MYDRVVPVPRAEVERFMKVMDQNELLTAELVELRRQHRALDDEITALSERNNPKKKKMELDFCWFSSRDYSRYD